MWDSDTWEPGHDGIRCHELPHTPALSRQSMYPAGAPRLISCQRHSSLLRPRRSLHQALCSMEARRCVQRGEWSVGLATVAWLCEGRGTGQVIFLTWLNLPTQQIPRILLLLPRLIVLNFQEYFLLENLFLTCQNCDFSVENKETASAC